jgi:hypothetical protein
MLLLVLHIGDSEKVWSTSDGPGLKFWSFSDRDLPFNAV